MVKTSNERGAGTDANVYLTIYGPKGDSGEQELSSSSNDFERNKAGGAGAGGEGSGGWVEGAGGQELGPSSNDFERSKAGGAGAGREGRGR